MKYILIFVLVQIFIQPSFAQHTSIKVDYKKGFNQQTDSILNVTITLLDSVINSASFKQKILAANFTRRRGYSNQEIYDLYKSGNENNNADNVINLKLEVYYNYAGSREVGNTTTIDDITHTYQEYITKNGASCYAAHIAHEYCHVLGFTHPKYHFLGHVKSSSVPYVVGDIVANILGAECP